MIIIGVIGKSSNPDCNKMAGLNMLKSHPSLEPSSLEPKDGNIKFFFEKGSDALFIHFETSYDTACMLKILEDWHTKSCNGIKNLNDFHSDIRIRFARTLLFAMQVCHLIVFVETGNTFDTSYLLLFKSLKIIR